MALQPGTVLGPFEVLRPIGAGGMGEVYEARDTRLGRSVAIKVLAPALAGDLAFRDRFTREARALARLAHPSICVLHDVGDVGGTMYLVLEYVDGQTLSARLARGPLSIEDIVPVAVAICRALSVAHRAGIAHRDLKPGNVMLTKSGVKLLDFGLAKEVGGMAAGAGDHSTAALLTSEGTLVGTPAYLAPEQLQGHQADARSDIFALGAVLFEAATGRRAFAGDTPVALAAAILSTDPPPPSAINPAIPAAFDAIVAGCLVKDPEERWQSAHDVGRQLTTLASRHSGPAATAHRSSWLAWTVAALATGAALAVGAVAWRMPHRDEPPAAVSFELMLPPGVSVPDSVEGNALALSPDGSTLAWVGERADGPRLVYVRALARLDSTPLAGTEGATAIFWSPDGKTIGFFTGGLLKRIDVANRAVVPICPVQPGIGYTGTWGADGQILIAPIQGEGIYRVSTSGGTPEKVVGANRAAGEHRVGWPWFVGDGRSAVFSVRARGGAKLMLWRPGQATQPVADIASEAQYVDPGYLVFTRNGSLLAQRFDAASGRVSGEAIPLAGQVRQFISSGWVAVTAARNGTIAFQTRETRSRLTWIDRTGGVLGYAATPGNYLDLAYGPDDDTVLASRTDPSVGSSYDVWSIDVARRTETRLTISPETEISPLVSPDRRSLFLSMSTGLSPPELYRRDLATGRDDRLVPADAFQGASSITHDGRTLIYEQRSDVGNWDVWMVPLVGTRTPVPLLTTEFTELGGLLSADDRLIAWVSNETGQLEVYVAPFPAMSPKTRVSADGGARPHWGRDGHELFFVDRTGMLLSATRTADGRIGEARPLLTQAPARAWLDYLPAPDGQRFLAIVPDAAAGDQPITVITHAVR